MILKTNRYQQMIKDATKRFMLYPDFDNQEWKSTVALTRNIKLPSQLSFRSSQQIEKNIQIAEHITHQSSKLYSISLDNNWPKSCIGLVLCEHQQNNQRLYVYGTGTLIHRNIVLTSAQNVYCRRLNTQYTNFRFIVDVNNNKCSGIYDVMKVHYPKEYTMQGGYENYNFAVLQLYNDLSFNCGYVGWKISYKPSSKKQIAYGYTIGNEEGFFNLRQIIKHEKQQQDQECCSGSGILVKENSNKYCIVGLQHSERNYFFLNRKMRNLINQWIELINIILGFHIKLIQDNNNIGVQECKYLSQNNSKHLTAIGLDKNDIEAQGCKYLSQASWTHLTAIFLAVNNIGVQGCKYLSQANWNSLTTINLAKNEIGAQGCKYLSQANWKYLTKISLWSNKIGTQGCKYLSQANWTYLNVIQLQWNEIIKIIYRVLLQQSYPNARIKI